MEGRLPETILKDGARSGVPRCGANRNAGRSGPRPLGLMAWRGQSQRLRCPTAGRRSVGPHPKTATVERREGSRSPRDRVVARRRRDRKKSAPVGAPSPLIGGTESLLSRRPLTPKPRGLAGGRKSEGTCEETHKPRAQQRAAGTNNTALFDIVNRDKANGPLCARRRWIVSRASAARPGT